MTKLPPRDDLPPWGDPRMQGRVRKLPKWSEEDDVAKLVDDVFLERERLDYEDQALRTGQEPDTTVSEIRRHHQARAINEARRGSYELLAEILKPRLVELMKEWGLDLPPKAAEVLAKNSAAPAARGLAAGRSKTWSSGAPSRGSTTQLTRCSRSRRSCGTTTRARSASATWPSPSRPRGSRPTAAPS